MGMFHTLRTRETDSTKSQETTSHENHISFQTTHTQIKLLKLSLGCQFIHKHCKHFGRHSWGRRALVLTDRWKQSASLGLHGEEYSAQWRFAYKLHTDQSFILLNIYLPLRTDTVPKAMRQKGLPCGNPVDLRGYIFKSREFTVELLITD